MNTFLRYVFMLALIFSVSCEENIAPPPNKVEFEYDQLVGFEVSEQELDIEIIFSQEANFQDTISVAFSSSTMEYETDFITEPVAKDGKIFLPFPEGTLSVLFQIKKVKERKYRTGDQVDFYFDQIPFSLVLGDRRNLTLSFDEITAEKATLDPNVGGEMQPNIVFVDLSSNRQVAVSRDKWDLGFYTKEGEFQVTLNMPSAMMARKLDKSDLTTVNSNDTLGFAVDFDLSSAAIDIASEEWKVEAKNWIDDPLGDMTKTAIAKISAIEDENKVYILTRGQTPSGEERGWKKIRILRNGTGYLLQHADINNDIFAVERIDRDGDYLFNYVNFDEGQITVEPKKEHWDIAFTVFAATIAFGPPGAPLVPYVFKDMVLQNRYRVETAQVLTSAIGYEAFGQPDIPSITFSSSQINIGSSWRNGGGPGQSPSLKTDLFYVVKDVQGNIYKLLFTALTQDGIRGRPKIEFQLVQKAE